VGVFVHRVAATVEDDEPGVGHLAFEVLPGPGVFGPIGTTCQDERRCCRLSQSIHHHRVVLQVQVRDAFGHTEAVCVAARAFVPAFPLLRVAEAGTRVEHDDAARHVGSCCCVRQRQVSTERVADQDGGTLQFAEQEVEVVKCGIAGERRTVIWTRRGSVTREVDSDGQVTVRKRFGACIPRRSGGSHAMDEDNRIARSAADGVELHAETVVRPGPIVNVRRVSTTDIAESNPAMIERIAANFAEGGAGIMHDLHLRIFHASTGRVRFEVDVVNHITHGGGVMCGQAILSCMDTGMVFAMMSLDQPDRSFTTVSLNTNFERAVPEDIGTVMFDAQVTKPGRSLVFGQIDLFLPNRKRAASATTTYMWL
jgi:acyl-coenzyme A thioesterase PaaI-like protein